MQRDTWLNQRVEEILSPERPICDSHHHLWDYPESCYLLPQLLADTGSGHRIESTVCVECGSMYHGNVAPVMQPVGETEFANGVGAMASRGDSGDTRVCAGIVGFADLLHGAAIGPVLDQHLRMSHAFRGVRHACAYDPSPDIRKSHVDPPEHLYLRDDFREGFAELGKRGLSFDAWLFHPQIRELTSLARAFPATTIVLDHCGGPLGVGPYAGRQDALFPVWQQDITALASCENVYAKLGGLLMPINGFGCHKRDRPPSSADIVAMTGRYYRHVIAAFGPERCMFESNFPVDRQSCSYAVLWNAFKRMGARYTAREQDDLFRDTAHRVYRLEQPL